MKICPICHARCFDDMDVCYGCMHHFEILPTSSPESALLSRNSASPDLSLPLSSVEDTGTLHLPLSLSVDEEVVPRRKTQPRHAALQDLPALSLKKESDVGSSQGFQAEYRLVISLEPSSNVLGSQKK